MSEIGGYPPVIVMVGIIATLMLLWLLLSREQVKKNLHARGFRPVQVQWKPFAYWASPYTIPFSVRYMDPSGSQHQGRCYVSQLDLRVRWTDENSHYLDADLPLPGRLVYLLISLLLLVFGLRCLLTGRLVLPSTLRHPSPLYLHGRPVGPTKERSYALIARCFSVIGWSLFLASLAIYTWQQ